MAILEKQARTSPPSEGRDRAERLRERLMAPVDASGLALYRIGFGALMTWEAYRFLDVGFIRNHYLTPTFLFTWWGFDWVKPHPFFSYVHLAIFALAAIGVALGRYYRPSAILLTASITYMFLLDKARYLNHVYLAALLAFVLFVVPAHAKWSMDAERKPWLKSETIPTWAHWFVRFQVGIPYFFAGVAKLNYDWLIRNEPLRTWMLSKTDFPLIGHFFPNEIATRTMALSSTLLDLSVPFLMLNRRLRAPAYGLALGFHFLNSRFFSIGVFPWMMIVVTTIFFPYDWPKRMIATLRAGPRASRAAILAGALVGGSVAALLPRYQWSPVMMSVGAFGVAVFVFHMLPERLQGPLSSLAPPPAATPWRRFRYTPVLAIFLAIYAAVQVLMPVRHFAIPGNVHWTDDAHRFSWHMLLRQKTGFLSVHVTDPASGETWTEDVSRHLKPEQFRWMSVRPDMIVQFAHYLERHYRELGLPDIQVRVESQAWLNSRTPQVFIDPDVDLTEVRRPVMHGDWIEPLEPYHAD